MDISALEADKLELHEAEVEIAVLLDSLLVNFAPLADEKNIRLENKGSDSLQNFYGDELRIKEILENLASNAIKFTPDQGAVTLNCEMNKESGMKISVSDTGIGMDEEGIQTALSMFGQIGRESFEEIEGTGLGLPLTKGLVEAHGGTIAISSKLGKGTTVTLSFPKERVV